MLEIFDRTRRRVAIAEHAYSVREVTPLNAVPHLYFSLPLDDPKNSFCSPFWYVRHDGGELYRIMPDTLTAADGGGVSYQCEHVLATLIDDLLFGHHVAGNVGTYTTDCINYILAHQLTRNWVLAACDFRRQFEYGWEQETLLSALFSIATPFADRYQWVTDTSSYPWKLSLKRLETEGNPEFYIRRRHNMTSFQRGRDPQQIVTRLYPLGYGEGVNQLDIRSVNSGVPYLQSPRSITDKYGIIERVWVDRRYEDPASLKAAAEAMLRELQEPMVSYEIGFQEMTSSDFDRAAVGKRVRIMDPESGEPVDTFITEITRNHEDAALSSLVVANRETSIASSVADLADRQRIEETYAQGATQIYSQALQANCDSASGAVMDFFIPEEMRIINKVLAKIRIKRFRAYSQATESAQQTVHTTTEAGGSVVTSTSSGASLSTSESGGGSSGTSSDGGGNTLTSEGGGGSTTDTGVSGINVRYDYAMTEETNGHRHLVKQVIGHQHQVTFPPHNHQIRLNAHSHTFSVPPHSHIFWTQGHSHNVTIPGHSHNVTIPAHAHNITPGIFQFGGAQSFRIFVGGVWKASYYGTTAEVDLTNLLLGADRRIPRGSWLSLEVRPDDLAYVSIDLMVQGFVQSRGDNTV